MVLLVAEGVLPYFVIGACRWGTREAILRNVGKAKPLGLPLVGRYSVRIAMKCEVLRSCLSCGSLGGKGCFG